MPQILDWVAQSYRSHSLPLNAQRLVNFYAEIQPQDAKSKTPVPVFGCPGMSTFAECGSGPIEAFTVMNSQLYAVSGQTFWQVNADGSSASLGSTLVQPNTISIDNNGIQVVWVDGLTGWQYSAAGGVAQITDANFFPADTVAFFDGYFCFNRKGTKEFFLSPVFAVTPFDATVFASKEATSDLLLGVANTHEQLLLFGQKRIEVWYDAGNAPPTFPFLRNDGALIQRGTISVQSIVLEDNTVFFLGDDGMFYRLEGFTPKRISNHAIERAWQSYPTMADCRTFSYTQEGHKFIHVTFPSGRATWVYDVATTRWFERESWLGNSEDDSIGRWRGNCAINCYDRILIGDSQSGKIGQLNFETYTEFGNTIRGLLAGPPIHTDRRRVFMRRFELDVENGVGVPRSGQEETLTYCANPVVIIAPTALTTADSLTGLAANVTSFLFSVWLLIPNGDASGLVFASDRLSIAINNDGAGTPQVEIHGQDNLGAAVVDAAYDFAGWTDWVNLMISFDTVSQQIQVWANTLVAGVLVETELTATALTWSSTNPIAGTDPWQISVV